jgi:response regulator of citrate/malate metabolism
MWRLALATGVAAPDMATIIVSGVDRSQRVIDALRLGAFDYLIKPCEHQALP